MRPSIGMSARASRIGAGPAVDEAARALAQKQDHRVGLAQRAPADRAGEPIAEPCLRVRRQHRELDRMMREMLEHAARDAARRQFEAGGREAEARAQIDEALRLAEPPPAHQQVDDRREAVARRPASSTPRMCSSESRAWAASASADGVRRAPRRRRGRSRSGHRIVASQRRRVGAMRSRAGRSSTPRAGGRPPPRFAPANPREACALAFPRLREMLYSLAV